MITCFLIYLLVHFGFYAVLLRRRAAFRRESSIFLYHLIPATVVAVVAALAVIAEPSPESLLRAALVLAVQGIYSLSFLELWALAQGGYSVHILTQLESGESGSTVGLEDFGAGKQRDRLRGLRALALIRPAASGYQLTAAGRVAAGFLNLVRRLANVREAGSP